ncbi:MAG: hypothetical protein SPD47_03160 [Oscillospiraceae bacterium]|nr:hypothetical protein [Oscillospiraceae bacterium]
MIFGFEITTGSIMFLGGIALAALTIVFAVIYLSVTAAKARKLLKKMDSEKL